MKKMKKIMAAAIAMMTFSTAAAVTGTVAWFTANNIVSANNMTVTAQAENGIVIAQYTGADQNTAPVDSAFDDKVDAAHASATLLPTWTNDATTWYHAASTQSANGQHISSEGYADVTTDAEGTYYLYNKFQIKATGAAQDVSVAQVEYVAGSRVSQDYDPAIRVLVKTTSTKIFAPIGDHSSTGTENLDVNASDTDAVSSATSLTLTDNPVLATPATHVKIIDNLANGAKADVAIYIWFDGEDAACKSDNIVDFSGITINVKFQASVHA